MDMSGKIVVALALIVVPTFGLMFPRTSTKTRAAVDRVFTSADAKGGQKMDASKTALVSTRHTSDCCWVAEQKVD